MRTRLSLIWILSVVCAAMALPATTIAGGAGFSAVVVHNRCDGADPKFKVKNLAQGSTNANKLTNETWVEQKPGQGGPWTRVYSWDPARYTFQINGNNHWLTSWRTWDGDQYHWYRIGFRVRAWHNRTLLSSMELFSRKC